MQISLRSQMIAGTAAIVGASAIAMTPVVVQQHALPTIQVPGISAEVGLAGFDSPITELIGAIGVAGAYVFSPGPNPLVGFSPAVTKLGLIPQIITNHLPIISQLGLNGSTTILTSAGLGLAAAGITSEVVWNLPGTLLDAATLVFNGQINAAVALLQAKVLAPLTQATKDVLNAVAVPIQAVVARSIAVASLIPSGIGDLITNTVNQGQVLFGAALKPLQDAFTAGSLEGAWNAIVDGYFNTLPRTIAALTFGTGAAPLPAPLPVFVPSIRTEITEAISTVATTLKNAPVPPPPFAAVAPKAAAAKSVAATLAAEEPAAVADTPSTTAGDNSATAGDNNGGGSSSGGSKSGGGHSKGTGGSRANR